MITFSYSANTGSQARTAVISIAGLSFAVWQIGAAGQYNQWVNSTYGLIYTIAGGGNPPLGNGDGGSALGARLNAGAMALDANANLFIADGSSNSIRRVDAGTGIITTVAGGQPPLGGNGGPAINATFLGVSGVAIDSAGNLFISDWEACTIRRVDAGTQIISAYAGTGDCGYTGDGGAATSAELNSPEGIAVDSQGNLYIADSRNQRIRLVNAASGKITTIAGTGTAGFGGDGESATKALFDSPWAVAIGPNGNIFIVDSGNGRIREVTASTGLISTVAGDGGSTYTDGTAATSVGLVYPEGVAVDAEGNLYISANGYVRRVDGSTGIITTAVGSGGCCSPGNDGVPPTDIADDYADQLLVDSEGNLYISNSSVQFLDLATPQVGLSAQIGSVGSAAGTGSVSFTVSPSSALWIVTSGAPWLTLTNNSGSGNGTVSYTYSANDTPYTRSALIVIEGRTFTLTQSGSSVSLTPSIAVVGADAGTGMAALNVPSSIAWAASSDSPWLTIAPSSGMGGTTLTFNFSANTGTAGRSGNITVAGATLHVSQSSPAGVFTTWGTQATTGYDVISTIAGGGTGGDGGPATSASLNNPRAVAIDAAGNLYIAEGSHIRLVNAASHTISTFAGGGAGGDGGPAASAQLNAPAGIAIDATGDVLFTDSNRIRRVDAQTGIISTVAGGAVADFFGDLGPASQALLTAPTGIALDAGGNLYFCDSGNYRVRRIDATTGVISTVAGIGVSGTIGDNGPATAAEILACQAIAIDPQGDLFIAVSGAIRRIDAVTGTITTWTAPDSDGIALGVNGVTIDSAGNIYASGNSLIWKVDPPSGTFTQSGGGSFLASPSGFGGDGGPLASAQFNGPSGLATDAAGNLYIADTENGRVRFVDFTTPQVALAPPAALPSGGAGTGSLAVTLAAGAPWFASSNAPWLTVTVNSGTGSGTIDYNFDANPSVFARTAIITSEGQNVTVVQPGSAVTLSTPEAMVSAAAGAGSFDLSVIPAASWTAQSSASWLTVSPLNGSAGTTLNYTYTANPSPVARAAAITVAGVNFTVVQAGTTGSWVGWATNSFYGQIRRFAGSGVPGVSGDYGPALSASISPQVLTTDLNGDVFFADSARVRRIDASTGIVTPAAGTGVGGFSGDGASALEASMETPTGLAIDADFNLYIADTNNHRIRRVDGVTGIITTIAGTGANGYGGDYGPATSAVLNSPGAMAADGAGDVFFVDTYYRVRRIDAQTGAITTVAGNGTEGFSGDNGPGPAAQISANAIASDWIGNLYISDWQNSRIRRVDALTGIITTVAGNGSYTPTSDGGLATQTAIFDPQGLVIDPIGDLYISEDDTIRRVDAVTNIITTVAGRAAYDVRGAGDGGPALDAIVEASPIAIDGPGNIYLINPDLGASENTPATLRVIDFTTPATMFAAPAVSVPATSGSGSVNVTAATGVAWTATSSASWLTLTSAAGSGNGSVNYSTDANNTPFSRVAVIVMNGQVFTVTQAGLPAALSAATSMVTTAAGSGTVNLTTNANWTAVSSTPWLTVTTSSGTGSATLTYNFTANPTANGRIAALTIAGQTFGVIQQGTKGAFTPWGSGGQGFIETIAGTSGYSTYSGDGGAASAANINVQAIATDANGNVWIGDTAGGRVRQVNSTTGIITTVAGTGVAGSTGDGAGALAAMVAPGSLAVDISGNLYIADTNYGRIREVNAQTGVISTIAGGGTGGDGGLATQASLNQPVGLFVDGGGNLYFADEGNNRVRRVDSASGLITTVAGTGLPGYSGDNNPAASAEVSFPDSVVLDPSGDVLIDDQLNARIRRVDNSGTITSVASLTPSQDGSYLAVTGGGQIYVTIGNYSDPVVQQVDPGSGVLTTVAGTSYGFSGDGGPAIAAQLSDYLAGIAVDGGGNLYIADGSNQRVRFVDMVTPAVVLESSSVNVGPAAGTGSVTVTVTPANAPWSAVSDSAWLTLTTAGGTGSGSLAYSYTSNPSGDPRTALVDVLGQIFTVVQSGSAISGSTVTLTPAYALVPAAAGSGTVQLTVSPAAAWTASSSASWLTLNPSSGNTSGTLTYTYSANAGAGSRTATITVADQTITLDQLGASGAYTPWGQTFNGAIFTIAGTGTAGYTGDQVTATQAEIAPGSGGGIAIDTNGNLFLADTSNNRVRRVDAATGIISTVAGTGSPGAEGDEGAATAAELYQPSDVKLDPAGNLFIADTDNNKVRRVDASTGIITTFAGTGITGFGGDGNAAVNASLRGPAGIAIDSLGNVFISDTGNSRVRRVDALTGNITTIAGTGTRGFSGDGAAATAALLECPTGLAFDAGSNLFIADSCSQRVRRVDAVSGDISTVAGGGSVLGDGGSATSAYVQPADVYVDRGGNLYIADAANNRVRRVNASTGVITTLAGGANSNGPSAGDGGPATAAELYNPSGVILDAAGNIYITDNGYARIRFVDLISPVATFAASSKTATNEAGSASVGIEISPAGAFWGAVSNASWLTLTNGSGSGSGTITFSFTANTSPDMRSATITAYGQTYTLVQDGTPLIPSAATVTPQTAIVSASAGIGMFTLTTSDSAWQASSSASWLTVSPPSGGGDSALTYSFSANTQTNARVATIAVAGVAFGVTQLSASDSYVPWGPGGYGSVYSIPLTGTPSYGVTIEGMAVDSSGSIAVSNFPGVILRLDAISGNQTTIAGTGGCCASTGDGGPAIQATLLYAGALAYDTAGDLLVAQSGSVRRIDAVTQIITTYAGGGSSTTSNGDNGPASKATIDPGGIALDGAGNLYITDATNSRLRYVNAATGIISTLAGTGTAGYSGDLGKATLAEINKPSGVAVDRSGNIYLSDSGNNRVRKINVSGDIVTIGGNGIAGYTGDGGSATEAQLNSPGALAVDRAGNVYIADVGNGVLRRIDATTQVITTVAGISNPESLAFDPAGNLYIGKFSEVEILDLTTPVLTFTPAQVTAGSDAGTGAAPFVVSRTNAPWSAFSADAWLTVTTPSGAGSGSVGYSFTENSSPYPRTGTISSLGQTFTITQAGVSASFTPSSVSLDAGAGSGAVALSVGAPVIWNAQSSAAWLTVTPSAGTGSTSLNYSWSANTAAASRTAVISALGQSFFVIQAGTSGTLVPVFTDWNTTFYSEIVPVAGTGQSGYSGDGGPALQATFNGTPPGLAVDSTGNIYIADSDSISTSNNRIRRVDAATGTITTIAGNGGCCTGGDGGPAQLASVVPQQMTISPGGDLYIAEPSRSRVRRIDGETGIITTVAGNGSFAFAGDGAAATAAALSNPESVALDASGALYIADTENFRVRRIDPSTGIITTVLGGGQSILAGVPGASALLNDPLSVAVDGNGNLFVLDGAPLYGRTSVSTRILRLDTNTGLVWPVVNGTGTVTGDGGPALTAMLGAASEITVDPAGNLYVAGSTVHRIDAITGIITTVAGNGSYGDPGIGGPALQAYFNGLSAIAVDLTGNLYLSSQNQVFFVDFTTPSVALPATVPVTQPAGSGSVPFTLSPSVAPWSASSNAAWITVTNPSGSGSGSVGFSFTANETPFTRLGTITILGQSTTVVQEGVTAALSSNSALLASTATTGSITLALSASIPWTAASSAAWLTVSPGSGSASSTLNYSAAANTSAGPRMATVTVAGQTFHVLQAGSAGQETPYASLSDGEIITAAGGGTETTDGIAATSATIGFPNYLATDPNGNLYLIAGEFVRRVDVSTGLITTVAGNGSTTFSGDGGPATEAGIYPQGLAFDGTGNLYISDYNGRIRRVDGTGTITTFAGTGTLGFSGDGGPALQAQITPGILAFDIQGNLYFVDGVSRVRRIDPSGNISTVAGTGGTLSRASANGTPATQVALYGRYLAVDASGAVYFADDNASRVYRIDPVVGTISTFAGGGSKGDDGLALNAQLDEPTGLAFDFYGDLYIADQTANNVRRVDATTGIITTVAGTGTSGFSGDGGQSVKAKMASPTGIAIDPAGDLYIADTNNQRIRFVNYSTPGATKQTITFTKPTGVLLFAPPVTLKAVASSGLPVTFLSTTTGVCTVSGSLLTPVAVGTCSVTATQAGNATYKAATPVTQSFAVQKAAQTITFDTLSSEGLGAASVALTATASSGLSVTFATNSKSVCTVSGADVTLVATGTCSITASQAGNSTYAAAAPVTQTFTVTGRPQTIDFGPLSNLALGTASFPLSATASSGLTVTFASNSTKICAVSGVKVTLVSAGTCSITAGQPGNSRYAAATPVTQTFTVLMTQTIKFTAPKTQALATGSLTLMASASSGLKVFFASNSSSVCSVSGNTVTLLTTGTCSITASQGGNPIYATAVPVTRTFTVD